MKSAERKAERGVLEVLGRRTQIILSLTLIATVLVAVSSGDRKADEIRVTQELLRHIEGFIRKHPEQWHVPHRIWAGSP